MAAGAGCDRRPAAKKGPACGSTRVLLVVLVDLTAELLLDKLFWVFSQFGAVQKMSAFAKDGKNQVLAQFEHHTQAQRAMRYLNGRELEFTGEELPDGSRSGAGRCTLAIVPSCLRQLSFRAQDEKNRDYGRTNAEVRRLLREPANAAAFRDAAADRGWASLDFVWGVLVGEGGWVVPPQDGGPSDSLPEPTDAPAAIHTGRVGEVMLLSGVPAQRTTWHLDRAPAGPSAHELTPAMLWRVAGTYGGVVCVKQLAKHVGCVLVQYTSAEECSRAVQYLSGFTIWSHTIEAKVSHHANALHWKGALTELERKMCTADDLPQPATPPSAAAPLGRPSRFVCVWGWPDGVEPTVQEIHAALECGDWVLSVDMRAGCCVCEFVTPEAAFAAVARRNTCTAAVAGARTTFHMHFTGSEVNDRDAGGGAVTCHRPFRRKQRQRPADHRITSASLLAQPQPQYSPLACGQAQLAAALGASPWLPALWRIGC
eukprot:TRINITY_DN2100_c12_g1_i1.p1 TRINITY_DN2100_c12_g1~~TRINITY_DN2100_c12_g1_i1.p1  ORF type:complete len:484 (+),score=143.82 TRINITY_DN2100_c12_g1_i1:196-1647(+)